MRTFLRLDRKSPEYKQLTAIVKRRDRALYYIYSSYMGFKLPKHGAEVHHIVRRGSGGPDLEWNMVSLPYAVHRFEVHGMDAEDAAQVEEKISAYMESRPVKEWREDHAEALERFYQHAEDAKLERYRKKYRLKKKPGWKF